MNKQELYAYLQEKGVEYEVTEHKPVYTIEEMIEIDLPYPEIIAKNLFVRDDKKRNYYLITVNEERRVNLKEFQAQFGTRKLSFGSENDLMDLLKLTRGGVSPFGLLNDEECKVQFYLGEELAKGRMGIHPMENTATVWIKGEDLLKLVREHGTEVTIF
ncbi:MAG: prolyl-tRNA synthetase associated domain-containing protein [Mogibacterium sp.]|nr:prolyl-tRNA synthetase associated domain-containing protein [Mogibacterium sp.]